jgi:dihydroceramidase
MYGPGSHGPFAPRSDFMSISLLVLGIASFLFHASLRHSLQFADELAMLGLTWSLLQGTLTVRQSPANARLITITLASVFPLCSAVYVWTGKIIYHVAIFAAMLTLIIIQGHYLFHWMKPEFSAAKRYRWRSKGRKALFILFIGYILWYVDLEYCAELRNFRERVGLPLAWVFELHGWWHILTAVSASSFMDVVRELHEDLRSEKEK